MGQRLLVFSRVAEAGISSVTAFGAIALPILANVPAILHPMPWSQQQEIAAADTLPGGRYAEMQMLLEKTFLKIDVLTLEVRLGDEDAEKLERLVSGQKRSAEIEDSVAAVAIASRDAWVRTTFQRGISLDQFLDGAGKDLSAARDAGVVSEDTYNELTNGLPIWFGFLAERGILDGDQILYRIRGDTLLTRYVALGGETTMERLEVDLKLCRAVLATYFVKGSQYRKGLMKSLFADNR